MMTSKWAFPRSLHHVHCVVRGNEIIASTSDIIHSINIFKQSSRFYLLVWCSRAADWCLWNKALRFARMFVSKTSEAKGVVRAGRVWRRVVIAHFCGWLLCWWITSYLLDNVKQKAFTASWEVLIVFRVIFFSVIFFYTVAPEWMQRDFVEVQILLLVHVRRFAVAGRSYTRRDRGLSMIFWSLQRNLN